MKDLNLSEWAVRHPSLVLFFIVALGVAGAWSYLGLGRAEDPSFAIKTMVIQAAWPGATAEEMERQVADRIEKKLQELPHLDHLQTYTRPGLAVIRVQLEDTTPPKAVEDLWYQVRKKVGDISATLPPGVRGPNFNDEYRDVFAAIFTLTGETGHADLVRYAEDLRQRLLTVPNVAKVEIVGEQDQKIFVEFSHRKLATLGIAPQQIFDSLERQNAVVPAGSIETAYDRVHLRVDGALKSAEAVAAVPVEADGRLIHLGDIADVRRGYQDPPSFTVRHNGAPAIGLAVSMTEGANGLAFGRDLALAVETIEAELPVGIDLHQIADQAAVIDHSINEFLVKFAVALVIVLLVSFASLGFRSGIVVALSVPLTLAATFVVMDVAGMQLDRISLGALILALGLLVDDAIIAIEMMIVKMEQGWDRVRAATFAWTSTALPMLTGTLVTVAGLLPVGFAQSTAGEYAGGIFWVVAIALLASWFVALVFTPYLGVKLLPDQSAARHREDDVYQTPFYGRLRRLIEGSVRRRKSIVAATVALLVLSGIGFAAVEQQFFPQSARPELLVELRMKEGASFQATADAAAQLEAVLKDDPDAAYFTTYTGAGAPRFYLALDPDLPNENFAKIVIMTGGTEPRERLRAKLMRLFEEERIPLAHGRVTRLDFGPPVGFPVQFRVLGPEPAMVRDIAAQVRDAMRANLNTRDVHLQWNELADIVRLEVDQDRARLLGLTPQDIAQVLQTLLTGLPITQYREGIELIDVVARAVPQERLDLDSLQDLTIMTQTGRAVPLSQIARIVYGHEEPILWRRNRDTVLSVRADIVDGVQAPDVTNQILPALDRLKESLPAGYRIETGGAIEESAKANAALFQVFPVMILTMLTLLMIQLQSFQRTILVFLTAPLGLIGATAALLAFDAPFGFVALLGIIALGGMIMRNAVILVDQIEREIAAGRAPWHAVIEATVRRTRPVVLTALAAIFAMVPLTLSVFWGPMAIVIMGGLLVATVLTILFLPALYTLWFRIREPQAEPSVAAAPPLGNAAALAAE